MVYLSLSVTSLEKSIEFYCEKLGIFESMAGSRLICTIDIDLIIDMYEIGTEEHRNRFGQDTHAISSFWIAPKEKYLLDDEYKIEIKARLQKYRLAYTKDNLLPGEYLYFIDPSGNKFTLSASYGVLV